MKRPCPYIPRALESTVLRLSTQYPVVKLIGSRGAGKTTLARHLFADWAYVNLEDPQMRIFAQEDLNGFFSQFPERVIIDEAQHVPLLLSKIQVLVDERGQRPGQFIITESHEVVSQSLAGRVAIVTVMPLSLAELSNYGSPPLSRDEQLVRGFMPRLYAGPVLDTTEYWAGYVATYVQKDIKTIASVQDELLFHTFLTLLAGRVGSLLNYTSLAHDLGVAQKTVQRWVSLLVSSHIVFLLPAWTPSRTSAIVKTPKLYFCDPGLASYLLGIGEGYQMARDPLRGNLFEQMVVSEAMKRALNAYRRPDLSFFRNSSGLEVDLLVRCQRQLTGYEIKSGESFSKDQLSNLLQFEERYREYLDPSRRGGLIYAGEGEHLFLEHTVTPYQKAGPLFEP